MLNDELNEAVKAVQEELNATEEEIDMAIVLVMSSLIFGFDTSLKERLITQIQSIREFRNIILSVPEDKKLEFIKETSEVMSNSKDPVNITLQNIIKDFVKQYN